MTPPPAADGGQAVVTANNRDRGGTAGSSADGGQDRNQRDRGRRDGETRGGGKDRKASSVRTGSSAELKLLKIAMLAAVLAKIAVVLLATSVIAAGVPDRHLQRCSPSTWTRSIGG